MPRNVASLRSIKGIRRLKGRELADKLACVAPISHELLDFIANTMRAYAPLPTPTSIHFGGYDTTVFFVAFVFQHRLNFSKKGNLVISTGALTLDSFGLACKRIAQTVCFPSTLDAVELTAAIDKRALDIEPDHVFYVDEAYKKLAAMDRQSDFPAFCMLCRNLTPADLCSVRIANGENGEGVFATRRIKAGEIVTLHPVQYVCMHVAGTGSFWFPSSSKVMPATEMLTKMLFRYMAKVEGTCLSVAADPSIAAKPNACAHLINDGAVLENKDFGYAELETYLLKSAAAQNTVFVNIAGVSVAAVATRDIARGDEIFTSYGFGYWAELLSR